MKKLFLTAMLLITGLFANEFITASPYDHKDFYVAGRYMIIVDQGKPVPASTKVVKMVRDKMLKTAAHNVCAEYKKEINNEGRIIEMFYKLKDGKYAVIIIDKCK